MDLWIETQGHQIELLVREVCGRLYNTTSKSFVFYPLLSVSDFTRRKLIAQLDKSEGTVVLPGPPVCSEFFSSNP